MRAESLSQYVGKNVRRLRHELGLSQEEFADRCGLHRTYVGAIERGERNITLATLARLASTLSVDPRELFEESNE